MSNTQYFTEEDYTEARIFLEEKCRVDVSKEIFLSSLITLANSEMEIRNFNWDEK